MSSSESEDIFDASRSPNTDDDTLPQLSDQQQSSSASSMSSRSRSSGSSAPTTVKPVKEKKSRTAEEVEMQKHRTQQSLVTKNANKERAKEPELQAKVKKAMSGVSDLQKSHEQIVTCNHKHAESTPQKADGIMVAKNNYGPGACISAAKIKECFEEKLTTFLVKAQCVSDENADALAAFLADRNGTEWDDHILWRRKNNPGAKAERNKTQKDKSQFHKMAWTSQAFLTVLKRGILVSPLQMICICEKANDKEFICINPWHFQPKNQSLNPSPRVVLVTACDQPKTAGAFDQQQVVGQSAVVPSGKPAAKTTAATTAVGDRSSLPPASSTIVQYQQQQQITNGPRQQQHQNNNLQISTNPSSPICVEPVIGTVINCHLLHGSSNQMVAQVAAADFRHHQYQPQQQPTTITNANNAFSTDWQCQTALQGMQTSTTMSPPYSQAHAGQQQPCWYDGTPSYNNVPSATMVTSALGSVPGYVAVAASAYNTPHIVHRPQQESFADTQQQAAMVSWPMNAGHQLQHPTTGPAPAIATTAVVGQQQQQMFVTGPQNFAPTPPYNNNNNNNNLAPTNGQQPIMMMGSSGQFQGGQSTTTIVYHQPQPQQPHQQPPLYQQQHSSVTNCGQQPAGVQHQQQMPFPYNQALPQRMEFPQQMPIPPHQQMPLPPHQQMPLLPHQQTPYAMNFFGHFQTSHDGTQQGGIGMGTSSSSHQQSAERVDQSSSAGTSYQPQQHFNSAGAGNSQQY